MNKTKKSLILKLIFIFGAIAIVAFLIFNLIFGISNDVPKKLTKNENFISNIKPILSMGKYAFKDLATNARYQAVESFQGAGKKVTVKIVDLFKKEKVGSDSSEALVKVSESGLVASGDQLAVAEDTTLSALSTVASEEEIYAQYLPSPSVFNFSTSAFTGSANISYPIKTPPGPGGFSPSVALAYSSATVDDLMNLVSTNKKHWFVRQSGPLGLGWNIAGGNFQIAIDNHGQLDPDDSCKWSWRISFPGGSAELVKVDNNGNKISRCNDDKINSAWKNGEWATEPELFLKIVEAPPIVDSSYMEGGSWRIKTADGTEYTFGDGIWDPNETHVTTVTSTVRVWDSKHHWWESTNWDCDPIPMSWKLYTITNPFAKKITYQYKPFKGRVSVPGSNGCGSNYIGRAEIESITYGPNEISFIYGKTREDWRIVKENNGDYVFEDRDELDENDRAIASTADKAISEIRVEVDNERLRTYQINYYDDFETRDSREEAKFSESGPMVWGVYKLSNELESYHLMLKSIQEFGKGVDLSGPPRGRWPSFPAEIFSYQEISYLVRWKDNASGETSDETKNSIYLKTADNGYTGKVSYYFEDELLPVKFCYANGTCKLDNDWSSGNAEETSLSLQRARIKKTRTENGLDEFWDTAYTYPTDEKPLGFLTDKSKGQHFKFLGYSKVEQRIGRKGLEIDPHSPPPERTGILSKTKIFFHQALTSDGCFKKDPRAGLIYKMWNGPGAGLISVVNETLNEYRFSQDNSCNSFKPDQIPLLVKVQSSSTNAGTSPVYLSADQTLLNDYCDDHDCAKTKVENTYAWDFSKTAKQNKDTNQYAALLEAKNYGDISQSGDESKAKIIYSHQTSGENWILNKPQETWLIDLNPSGDDEVKYNWQRFFYDGRNDVPGSIPANNPKGLVTAVELEEFFTEEKIKTEQTYDSIGNANWQKDAMGNESWTRYDSSGIYPIEVENALHQVVTTEYDSVLGVPTKITDANNIVTESSYDVLGRLRKVVQPGDSFDDPSLEFIYFIGSDLGSAPMAVYKKMKMNNEDSYLESYAFYNGIGQKFETQAKQSNGKVLTKIIDFDSLGRNTVAYSPFESSNFGVAQHLAPEGIGKTITDYDSIGRLYQVIAPDGSVSSNLYRQADFTFAAVDSENRVAVFITDGLGRTKKMISCREHTGDICSEADNITTAYEYDVLGNVTEVIDSAGKVVTTNTYDSLGRKKMIDDSDLGHWEYDYDKNGNLTGQKDPEGNNSGFSRDELNRITTKWFGNCGPLPCHVLSYTYDQGEFGIGRKSSFSDKYQTTTYTYDQRGHLISESESFASGDLKGFFGLDPYSISYTYDDLGRIKSMTYPQTPEFVAETIDFAYDGIYLKSMVGEDTYVSNLDYNFFGQLISRTLGNNVTENFSYDLLNQRLTTLNVDQYLNLNYNYNSVGNITSIVDTLSNAQPDLSMSQDFTYDNFYRLTGVSGAYDASFVYDDLDRMTTKTEGSLGNDFGFSDTFPYHGIKYVGASTNPVEYDLGGNILSYDTDYERNITWDYSIGKPEKIEVILPKFTLFTLAPGVNFDLQLPQGSNMSASEIIQVVEKSYNNCNLDNYISIEKDGWLETYFSGWSQNDFQIKGGETNFIMKNNGNLPCVVKWKEQMAMQSIPIIATEFFYNAEGSRIAKKRDDNNYTLYINAYLEKHVVDGVASWRKNYFVGGKLTAVKVVEVE